MDRNILDTSDRSTFDPLGYDITEVREVLINITLENLNVQVTRST
jgi:hypothetical protein